MFEFVHEDAAQRLSERPVLVFAPESQVLSDAMDFDRLEHEMDGGGSKKPADRHDERQFEPASRIQLLERETKEVLPKCEVGRFDRNQFIQGGMGLRRGDLP